MFFNIFFNIRGIVRKSKRISWVCLAIVSVLTM